MCAIASTTCFFTFFFFASAMFQCFLWEAAMRATHSSLLRSRRRGRLLRCLVLLPLYRPPRPFPRASICASTLAAQRQASPMTNTTVRTEVHQTFDIHGDLAAKIAFDLEICNSGPEIRNFRLSKIFYLSFRSDTGCCADLLCARMTDTENRRQ